MNQFIAAYRLQLNADFDFTDARGLVPYLEQLGVSHLYLSPILQARHGSTHGYDVIDPTRISEELGGETGFVELAGAGLGIILDIVPNHMAKDPANPFWADDRLRPRFFDIDEARGFQRHFFDVDDLVGVRVEDPQVFSKTHQKIQELLERGLIEGLRVDHVDGLADPAQYLERLERLGASHVWVEKILAPGERLRPWPVRGTTGYEFLNDLTALFVDPNSEELFTEISEEFRPFVDVAFDAKLQQARTSFAREAERLRSLLETSEIEPALASLLVYRTYLVAGDIPVDDDIAGEEPAGSGQFGAILIDEADRRVIEGLPEPVRSALLVPISTPSEFVIRFQQTTAAVMAKGVEDTALYRYVRLLALNEVGGDPGRYAITTDAFHGSNLLRAETLPLNIVSSQTHDTKRSGDVRARIVALSHRSEDWGRAVRAWREINSRFKEHGAPDWTEELFIYQTLVGGWPIARDRLEAYLTKALREAKRNTNWIAPDHSWERRVFTFCDRICSDTDFLSSFEPFAEEIALAGERISLAQLVLRMTAPGLPDIYQGDEHWNFTFVDPDNRRPIDWDATTSRLARLRSGDSVLGRMDAKLFATISLLALRRRRSVDFAAGYSPLSAPGTTCAYRRGEGVIVAVDVRGGPLEFEPPGVEWTDILRPLESVYPRSPFAVFERTPTEIPPTVE